MVKTLSWHTFRPVVTYLHLHLHLSHLADALIQTYCILHYFMSGYLSTVCLFYIFWNWTYEIIIGIAHTLMSYLHLLQRSVADVWNECWSRFQEQDKAWGASSTGLKCIVLVQVKWHRMVIMLHDSVITCIFYKWFQIWWEKNMTVKNSLQQQQRN
jgi:hypothetical protein